jgi:hypothetical protein
VVIADLTGSNPNVFYELGITHSFARPLISVADSSSCLPFDAKDERVIELGEYPPSGLAYVQGERAKASLQESLRIVRGEHYSPPSPLREVAANRSVDQLAPEDPVAREMAQMRETLEEIRKNVRPRTVSTLGMRHDIAVLRAIIKRNLGYLDEQDFQDLIDEGTSPEHDSWTEKLEEEWRKSHPPKDPWADDDAGSGGDGASDEPPF